MRRDGTQAAAVRDGARTPARARARRATRRGAWRALSVSRLVVWVAGAAAAAACGLSARADAFDPGEVTRPFGALGDALVAPVARWDSVWFLAIANDGYRGRRRRAAFFPLYPLLVRAAGVVTGAPLVAGALVSLACFAAALVLLHRLVELDLGAAAAGAGGLGARRCSPARCSSPRVYSESLFLALSVGAVYAARTGRWALGGRRGRARRGDAQRRRRCSSSRSRCCGGAAGGAAAAPGDAAWIALVPLGLAGVLRRAGARRRRRARAVPRAGGLASRTFAGPFGGDRRTARSRRGDGLGHRSGDPRRRAHDVVLFALPASLARAARSSARCAGCRRPTAPTSSCALALPLSYPGRRRSRSCRCRASSPCCSRCSCGSALWLAEGGRARRVGRARALGGAGSLPRQRRGRDLALGRVSAPCCSTRWARWSSSSARGRASSRELAARGRRRRRGGGARGRCSPRSPTTAPPRRRRATARASRDLRAPLRGGPAATSSAHGARRRGDVEAAMLARAALPPLPRGAAACSRALRARGAAARRRQQLGRLAARRARAHRPRAARRRAS